MTVFSLSPAWRRADCGVHDLAPLLTHQPVSIGARFGMGRKIHWRRLGHPRTVEWNPIYMVTAFTLRTGHYFREAARACVTLCGNNM